MSLADSWKSYLLEDKTETVKLLRVDEVCPGVTCYVYEFTKRDDCDLGVIRIRPGFKTPVQLVAERDDIGVTLEHRTVGEGTFRLRRKGGEWQEFSVGNAHEVTKFYVQPGDEMQWVCDATSHCNMIVAEVCWPKWDEDRFIDEEV